VRTEIAFPTHSAFEKILLHEHPGFLPIFTFGPPGIFAGDPREADMKAHFDYVEIYADNAQRSQAHSHKPIVIARNLRLKPYARLLAKIGHAYAVAELGMTGFKPYLNDLILGKPPLYPGFYIGGLPSQSPPYGRIPTPGKERHEIGFESTYYQTPSGSRGQPTKYVTVRIRLFGYIGGPIHYAVAGELLPVRSS
jgi:hypothetical protein